MASPLEITIPNNALPAVLQLANGKVVLEAGMRPRVRKIPFGPGTAVEVTTTAQLGANEIVRDILVEVLTPETTGATKNLDIGTLSSESGGDADGFADAIDVSAAGIFRPGYTLDGTGHWYVSATRGAKLALLDAGSSATIPGLYAEKPYIVKSLAARTLSYTRNGVLTEATGYIWVFSDEINAAL